MKPYHIVDNTTNLVIYVDRMEDDDISVASAAYPGHTLFLSEHGQPNKPTIFPGYLYHEGVFWSPQRGPTQITSDVMILDKADFLRLFTFSELSDIYNFMNDSATPEIKKTVNAFLRYLDGVTKVGISHPTIRTCLDTLETAGYISSTRRSEIGSVLYKQ